MLRSRVTSVAVLLAVVAMVGAAAIAPAGAVTAPESSAAATTAHTESATGEAGPVDGSNPTPRGTCPGTATTFSDVAPTHPFCVEIEWLAARGIGQGFGDGTFRPGNDITRQAVAAFLYRLAGEPAFAPPATPTFSDVGVGHPFRKEVEWLADRNIGGGFPDGTFRPGNNITRQALAAFLFRYDGSPAVFVGPQTFSDVGTTHPFRPEIEWLANQGIGQGFGDGTFRPGNDITRQAVAAFLYRSTDMWVIVAADGSIRTSRNTQGWELRRPPGGAQLNAVASNHLGVWVAVGFAGTVLRSTDGINWAPVSSGTTQILWDVAHDGNGTMLAVGDAGVMRRSTNTTSWSAVTTPVATSLQAITHDRAGRWLAVGTAGSAITSTNSTNWFTRTTGTDATLQAVGHDGTTFLAAGVGTGARATTSASNATSWSPVNTNDAGLVNDIAHDGVGRWVIVATAGKIRTPTNVFGIWTVALSGTSEQLHGVDHGGDRWVLVGENGVVRNSTNGTLWNNVTLGTTANLMGVAAIDR